MLFGSHVKKDGLPRSSPGKPAERHPPLQNLLFFSLLPLPLGSSVISSVMSDNPKHGQKKPDLNYRKDVLNNLEQEYISQTNSPASMKIIPPAINFPRSRIHFQFGQDGQNTRTVSRIFLLPRQRILLTRFSLAAGTFLFRL